VLREFRFRVHLYSEWDRRLASRTRFFGAAALVNAALGDLCAHRATPLLLSLPTREFLAETGRRLESLNVGLAARIHRFEIRVADLDAFMVITEQDAVERELQSVRDTDGARFDALVTQLNRVLHLTGQWFWPGRCAYAGTLASIRGGLRRPVDFASKEDRVHIGRRLISHLRI
jgi:hypothetical protein